MSLAEWAPRSRPAGTPLEGRYTRLEKLAPSHADTLFDASNYGPLYKYLFDSPPSDRAAFDAWLKNASTTTDPLFYAVIDRANGHAEGRQALMRITPEHGVIEVGSILWGTRIQRTRVATEAIYLFAKHAFDDLGYRRFEWKCDSDNVPSCKAAVRFGFKFEGIFRQHMVVKHRNRDTAWFAMTDGEWPQLKARFERWLEPSNFDERQIQYRPLEEC